MITDVKELQNKLKPYMMSQKELANEIGINHFSLHYLMKQDRAGLKVLTRVNEWLAKQK